MFYTGALRMFSGHICYSYAVSSLFPFYFRYRIAEYTGDSIFAFQTLPECRILHKYVLSICSHVEYLINISNN